jgi:hypothetical protein
MRGRRFGGGFEWLLVARPNPGCRPVKVKAAVSVGPNSGLRLAVVLEELNRPKMGRMVSFQYYPEVSDGVCRR